MKLLLALLTCFSLGVAQPKEKAQKIIAYNEAEVVGDGETNPDVTPGETETGGTETGGTETGGTENPDETPTEKVGTVVITATEHGEVLADIEEGKVGDKVTLYVKGDFLYSVVSVKVNETDLVANEKGNYEFLLVEGENVVTATFKVDNAQVEEITKIIDSIKENGIESFLTVDNLLTLIYFLISAIFSSGFFVSLLKSKKLKNETIEDVSRETKKVLEKCTKEEIVAFLKNTIQPTVEKMLDKIDETNKISTTLCECFILAQEDTPEARLAIVEKLTNLQVANKELSEIIKQIIKDQQKEQEDLIAERDRTIQELKEANENIPTKETKEEPKKDEIGQL